MKICLITPAPAHSRKGNRVTALRWAHILRKLGHRVVVEQQYAGRACDLLVALHARRSFTSVERFRKQHPGLPLVLALTGTDLYADIQTDPLAQQSLEMATRLILLQPMGIAELPKHLRVKARVIYQSAQKPPGTLSPRKDIFEVGVMGHLRPVKDPFRAALAARMLPTSSRIQVVHVGAALSEAMEKAARAEQRLNPRYRWLGELPRWKALRLLARCRLLVLSSKTEGGANVLSEAIAISVPALASRIPGSIGILGPDYPGYFPVGDTQALAKLLNRAERDPKFLQELQSRLKALEPLVDPARERQSWQCLLEELGSRQGMGNREQEMEDSQSCDTRASPIDAAHIGVAAPESPIAGFPFQPPSAGVGADASLIRVVTHSEPRHAGTGPPHDGIGVLGWPGSAEVISPFRKATQEHETAIAATPTAPSWEVPTRASTQFKDSRFKLIDLGSASQIDEFAHEVRAGLTTNPKRLSCRFFYDREGSELFEAICELPEYYLMRVEREILRERAGEIAELFQSHPGLEGRWAVSRRNSTALHPSPIAGAPKRRRVFSGDRTRASKRSPVVRGGTALVELGSGSAAKTRILIDEILRYQDSKTKLRYVPVDISRTMLEKSSRALLEDYPALEIIALAGEYYDCLPQLNSAAGSPKLVLWLGSNVGNLDRSEAASFLKLVRGTMHQSDRLLIGIDLRKERGVLEKAYDDAAGVTARFNRNILARINRELGGQFDLGNFQHRAFYDDKLGRVEMYLVSRCAQRVHIELLDLEVSFAAGERIQTENSYKYSLAEIEHLAASASFLIERQWLDASDRFSVNLFAPTE